MKKFTSFYDLDDPDKFIDELLNCKTHPNLFPFFNRKKTVGMVFLQPSLRTRWSMENAANQLGVNTIVSSAKGEVWSWETAENCLMNGDAVEHIKDAAKIMGQNCDALAIRSFANLIDQKKDENEDVLSAFIKYSGVPVISMESALLHPLQSLADVLTIKEVWKKKRKPKIALCWAPHVKPLPHAVANSFCEWTLGLNYDLRIVCPPGLEPNNSFSKNAPIYHSQKEGLKGVDFVYFKSWSSYQSYGHLPKGLDNWLLQLSFFDKKLPFFMHCLPVRRNCEVSDAVLDHPNSLVYKQSDNRIHAAKMVLSKVL